MWDFALQHTIPIPCGHWQLHMASCCPCNHAFGMECRAIAAALRALGLRVAMAEVQWVGSYFKICLPAYVQRKLCTAIMSYWACALLNAFEKVYNACHLICHVPKRGQLTCVYLSASLSSDCSVFC